MHPKLLTLSDWGVSGRNGLTIGQSEILTELGEYGTEINARNESKLDKAGCLYDNAACSDALPALWISF